MNRLSDLYRDVDECLLVTYPELDPFNARDNATYLGVFPDEGGVLPSWPETGGRKVLRTCGRFAALKNC